MGHITHLAGRLAALEQSQVDRARTDIENTREKRALLSELRVLSACVDEVRGEMTLITERASEIQQRSDEHHAFMIHQQR